MKRQNEESSPSEKRLCGTSLALNEYCFACGQKLRNRRRSDSSELEFPLLDPSDLDSSPGTEKSTPNKVTVLQNVIIRPAQQTIERNSVEYDDENRQDGKEAGEKKELQREKWLSPPVKDFFPPHTIAEASANLPVPDKRSVIIIDDSSDENDNDHSQATDKPSVIIIEVPSDESYSDHNNKIAGDKKGSNLSFDYIYMEVMSSAILKSLFTSSEIKLLSKFHELNPASKSLCLHLFIRGNVWNNAVRLAKTINCKVEIPRINEFCGRLHVDGILLKDLSSESTSESLLKTLHIKDLDCICKKLNIVFGRTPSSRRRRKVMLHALLQENGGKLRNAIHEVIGEVVKLTQDVEMCLTKLHLLYTFANEDLVEPKMLYEFLHKRRNEEIILMKYQVDKVDFFQMDSFDSYVQAFLLKKEVTSFLRAKKLSNYRSCFETSNKIYKALEKLNDSLYQMSYPEYIMQFSAGSIYTNVLSDAAIYLAKKYTESAEKWLLYLLRQNLYAKHKRGLWYDTLATIYFKYLKNMKKAISVITEAMAEESLSEVDRLTLSLTGKAMKNSQLCRPEYRDQIDRWCLPTVCKFVSRNILCTREYGHRILLKSNMVNFAIHTYRQEGFTFNLRLTNFLPTVVGIFLSDVIYDHYVRYAFVSDIQLYPLDLLFNFYEMRRNKIDKALNNIEKWSKAAFISTVKEYWKENSNKKTLVDTNVFNDVQDLLKVFLSMDRRKLPNIIRRLLVNYQQNVLGFADLFIMNAKQEYKFVYILRKGQSCTAEQMLWIRHLQTWGLNVEVCFLSRNLTCGCHICKD